MTATNARTIAAAARNGSTLASLIQSAYQSDKPAAIAAGIMAAGTLSHDSAQHVTGLLCKLAHGGADAMQTLCDAMTAASKASTVEASRCMTVVRVWRKLSNEKQGVQHCVSLAVTFKPCEVSDAGMPARFELQTIKRRAAGGGRKGASAKPAGATIAKGDSAAVQALRDIAGIVGLTGKLDPAAVVAAVRSLTAPASGRAKRTVARVAAAA